MKIFLLGHKGFIGSHLLKRLVELGHNVKTDPILHWGQEFDLVINLAAKTHIRNEFDPALIESNFILMNKVFERSERIVYASSCSASHFTNPYAMSKMWAEYLGWQHHNALGLRFHNVYGPNNNKGIIWYLMQQPDGANIEIRGPETIRDYVHVDDVVAVIVKYALDEKKLIHPFNDKNQSKVPIKNNGILEIGTCLGTSTFDVVTQFMEISGRKFNVSTLERGNNEPDVMVAKTIIGHDFLSLGNGIEKLLSNHSKFPNGKNIRG